MSDALSQGERIEIRGFGSFSLHFRPPRQGRNPKTGEAVALVRQVRAALQARQGPARARQQRRRSADPRLSVDEVPGDDATPAVRPAVPRPTAAPPEVRPPHTPLSTDADGVRLEPHRTGHRLLDFAVAGSAILISLISLAVAIHLGQVQSAPGGGELLAVPAVRELLRASRTARRWFRSASATTAPAPRS